MSYSSFIMFAADFGLLSSRLAGILTPRLPHSLTPSMYSLNLTNMELGDIYLTTIAFSNFKASVRKIDFKEFWEVTNNVLHTVVIIIIVFSFLALTF